MGREMITLEKSKNGRVDVFFATPGAREDRWRDLVDAAKKWAAGTGSRAAFESALNDAAVIEEFHGYPGPSLMAALRDRAESDNAARPYFEVLIVTGAPIERWPSIAAEWRRLRRLEDEFVYEPVIVGSAEDAVCAA